MSKSHNICIIHVATNRFPIQRLLAWHIATCNAHSSRECRGLPRHTIMCNSLGSTWKSRSDSGEHWMGGAPFLGALEGGAPFLSRQCFPNIIANKTVDIVFKQSIDNIKRLIKTM